MISSFKLAPNNSNFNLYYLSNYNETFPNVWKKILTVLLDRAEKSDFKFDINLRFAFKQYLPHLEIDLSLLKRLYFYAYSLDISFDYDNKVIETIIRKDNNFLIEYLNKINNHSQNFRENNKLDFIWQFDNYQQLINKGLDYFVSKKDFSIYNNFASIFFPKSINRNLVETFIKDFIKTNYSNKKKMQLIFNVILENYTENRVGYLEELINFTTDEKIIKELPLISNSMSGASFVPHYERNKKFWEQIELIFSKDLDLLQLKNWAKQKQKYCSNSIENELKREFVNEY